MIIYGHGLLGDSGQVASGAVRATAAELCMVVVGTDMRGMSTMDVGAVARALENLSHADEVMEVLVQGIVNHVALERAARTVLRPAAVHRPGQRRQGPGRPDQGLLLRAVAGRHLRRVVHGLRPVRHPRACSASAPPTTRSCSSGRPTGRPVPPDPQRQLPRPARRRPRHQPDAEPVGQDRAQRHRQRGPGRHRDRGPGQADPAPDRDRRRAGAQPGQRVGGADDGPADPDPVGPQRRVRPRRAGRADRRRQRAGLLRRRRARAADHQRAGARHRPARPDPQPAGGAAPDGRLLRDRHDPERVQRRVHLCADGACN